MESVKVLRVFSMSREEALKIRPHYYEERGANAWTYDEALGAIVSNWGRVEIEFEASEVEIQNEDGTTRREIRVNFDRPSYYEEPAHIDPPGTFNIPTYTVAPDGTAYLLVVAQDRAFPRNLDGARADPAIKFAQAGAMFFRDKISQAFDKWENGDPTARTQIGMELGIGEIKALRPLTYHYPTNTHHGSATLIGEAEIDWEVALAAQNARREREETSRVIAHPDSPKVEFIGQAELVSIAEYFNRIQKGYHNGVCYLAAVPISFVTAWLAHHPEFRHQLVG